MITKKSEWHKKNVSNEDLWKRLIKLETLIDILLDGKSGNAVEEQVRLRKEGDEKARRLRERTDMLGR